MDALIDDWLLTGGGETTFESIESYMSISIGI